MAQEQSAIPFYDFMYPKLLLKDLYDIDIQPDDYLERAYNVFRAIGNIATGVYTYNFTIDDTLKVQLPCNLEFIESVSTDENQLMKGEELLLYTSNENISPNAYLADITNNESLRRINIPQSSNLHPTGRFLPYNLGGKNLIFSPEQSGTRGICIYRGILVDDHDNPLLFRKEAEAIAAQLAFIDTQKKMFMRDPSAAGILGYIKPEAARLMAAAKIPEYVTQNQWDRVLAAKTRHDRKIFNSTFKPLQ
jgi:hypothetical protein